MEGIDNDWQITDQTSLRYPKLPPGSYQFTLYAINNDEIESTEPVTFKVTVIPPFWSTLGFKAMSLIAIVFVLILAYWYITRRIKATERRRSEIKQKIAESEMKALRSQMNPHFIFNALNSIQRFIIKNDKIQASNYLSKFATLVRSVLENAQYSDVVLEDEMKALNLYLELEALRFKSKMEYNIEIEDNIDPKELKIPSMLIQPFVENAIKHGILHKKNGGRVDIKIRIEDSMLICVIEDDGVGRKKAQELKDKQKHTHQSLGMQVTQERLDILNAQRANKVSIKISDLHDEKNEASGTRVEIFTPIDNHVGS